MSAGPPVVTLCGSMSRFPDMLALAGELTAEGYIVHLPVPVRSGDPALLRAVHLAKIIASDLVYAFPKAHGGLGDSTRDEVAFAQALRIPVRQVGIGTLHNTTPEHTSRTLCQPRLDPQRWGG